MNVSVGHTRPGHFASETVEGFLGFGMWKGHWAFRRKAKIRCRVLEDQAFPRLCWGSALSSGRLTGAASALPG